MWACVPSEPKKGNQSAAARPKGVLHIGDSCKLHRLVHTHLRNKEQLPFQVGGHCDGIVGVDTENRGVGACFDVVENRYVGREKCLDLAAASGDTGCGSGI